MKKTFNINVAGFPFIIDDDAYTLLDNYLQTIENAFAGNDETRELANDIESRVAELLMERTSTNSPIVSVADVEEVISRVGQPEEIMEEDETISIKTPGGDNAAKEDAKNAATPPPYIPPVTPIKKKLFRDPQNTMIGGVCSGLAWYLNMDPTIVRLLTVLITMVSMFSGAIAYLILMLVVPEAKTPLERMQMMGEEPTVKNIGKTVTDNFRDDNTSASPQKTAQPSSFAATTTTVLGILANILLMIGLVIAVIVLISMAIGLIGCLFALIVFGTSWGGTLIGENTPCRFEAAGTIPVYGVLCGIGGILALGIPLYVLVRRGFKKDKAHLTPGVRNTLIALCALGFIMAAVSTGRIINLQSQQEEERWLRQEHTIEHDHMDYEEQYPDDVSGSCTNASDTIVSDTITTDARQDIQTKTDSIM